MAHKWYHNANTLFLLLFSMVVIAASELIVTRRGGDQMIITVVSLYYDGNSNLEGSISGMLSIGFSDGLFNTNDDNFIPFNDTNAIAMTEQADLPIENNLRRLIERSAQGIVIARNTQFSLGRIMYNINGTDTSDITVPVVEISLGDYNRIKEWMLLDGTLYLAVTLSPGYNAWYDYNSGPYLTVWQVTMAVFTAVALALALRRLILLLQGNKLASFWLARTAYIFEIIGLTLRLLYTCLNPLGGRRTTPWWLEQILRSLNIPFNLATAIMVTFFWHFELSKSTMISLDVGKTKLPIFIAIFLVFILEFSTSIPRAFNADSQSIYYILNAVIYCLSVTILGVFYVITGKKVIKHIELMGRDNPTEGEVKKQKRMRIVSAKIIISGVCLFCIAIIYILTATPIYSDPFVYGIVWWLIFGLFNTLSVLL